MFFTEYLLIRLISALYSFDLSQLLIRIVNCFHSKIQILFFYNMGLVTLFPASPECGTIASRP